MQEAPVEIANGLVAFAETAIVLADADREEELAALLASHAALSSTTVLTALAASATDATTAVCRLARLPLNSYSAVLRMRVRKRRQSVDPYRLLVDYRQTAPVSAAELARMLRHAHHEA